MKSDQELQETCTACETSSGIFADASDIVRFTVLDLACETLQLKRWSLWNEARLRKGLERIVASPPESAHSIAKETLAESRDWNDTKETA